MRSEATVAEPPRSPFVGDRKQALVLFAAFFLGLLVVYAPALRGGLVWDDDQHIGNANMHDFAGLVRTWVNPRANQQYYPLTHTSFWIEYRLFGANTTAYHVTNVLLHAASAVLVVLVGARLSFRGALFAGLLFAFHPVQVESVAWITERKNCLAGFLALLATYAFVRALEERGRKSTLRFVGALLAFASALLAKTAVATLPAVLLLIALASSTSTSKWRTQSRRVILTVPFFVIGLAGGLLTAWLERTHVGAEGAEFSLSFAEKILVAGRAFFFYVGKFAWPVNLAFIYPRWTVSATSPLDWLWPLGVGALFAGLFFARRRLGWRPLLSALAYGALAFPALHFFKVYFIRFSFVQDHFQYFAFIPLALFTAHVVFTFVTDPRVGRAGGGLIVVGLGLLSMRQASSFANIETLFRRASAANKSAWMPRYNLAHIFVEQHRSAEAIPLLEEALTIRPDDADSLTALGAAAFETGALEQSLGAFQRAAELRPNDAISRLNFAEALDRVGEDTRAVREYEAALVARPGFVRAERELAWILATTGGATDVKRAVTLAEVACQKTKADIARCLDTLAVAYAANGYDERALKTSRDAVDAARDPVARALYEDHHRAIESKTPIRKVRLEATAREVKP